MITWCEHYRSVPPVEDTDDNDYRMGVISLSDWDHLFFGSDHVLLFEVAWAADYMDVKALL